MDRSENTRSPNGSANEAALARAGLKFLGWHKPRVPYIPPALAVAAVFFPKTALGWMWTAVKMDDPDILEKANAAWYQLAIDGDFFTREDPRFLLALKTDPEGTRTEWAVVRLTEPWDIMGAGAEAGLLGPGGWCRPTFVMLSLDGNVILRGDTWETEIGVIRVRTPHHKPHDFMEFAWWMVESDSYNDRPEFQAAATEWLRSLD